MLLAVFHEFFLALSLVPKALISLLLIYIRSELCCMLPQLKRPLDSNMTAINVNSWSNSILSREICQAVQTPMQVKSVILNVGEMRSDF